LLLHTTADSLLTFRRLLERFTRATLASAGISSCRRVSVCPSVRLLVCPSVAIPCSTETATRRITQTTPHDTTGILVF